MSRPVVVLGRILAGVIVLVAILLGVLYAVAGTWMSQTIQVDVEPLSVPADSLSIARGEHIYQAIGACAGCHAEDAGGMNLVNSAVFAHWNPPNLTSGEGGIGADYTVNDWRRAIQHGVAPGGRPLIMMPSPAYYDLSDSDIAALIAYLRDVPPVDRTLEPSTLNVMGRVAVVMGAPFLVARDQDHDAPRMTAPTPSVSVAYGEYLSRVCAFCHGPGMAGSVGPDLRPKGAYAHVDYDRFTQIMRTGINAAGQQMDPHEMPWPEFSRLTNDEMRAIWMYLETLPAE